MVEIKQESRVCCEELGESKGTVEYGYEEPSEAVYPVEPGKPMVTHMSGIKPERKPVSVLMKIAIIGIVVAFLLGASLFIMLAS